jgi:TRAP-type C4-dicarboxylate transport system substrate-binding protein
MSDMIKALGAEPVELPYGQAMDRTCTKADRRRGEQLAVLRHHRSLQIAGYYTLTEHTMSPEVLVMSRGCRRRNF